MALGTAFLLNLLCSVVSCSPQYPTPQIIDQRTSASEISNEVLNLEAYVDTRFGGLNGYPMRTVRNRRIYAFEGIPYALPPIGELRFRPPVPLRSTWGITRNAKHPGPSCLQINPKNMNQITGSEDCLYLNVYTPQVPYMDGDGNQVYMEPYPVIIWIHGGEYLHGSGNEMGPSYLLENDVILVTFNYRLGVLGFMSTGDESSPGNFGLRDQSMVIRWVHDNIFSFGGDPNKISVMGHNSGASSAQLHAISKRSSPYFHTGASLSGSAFTHWAVKSPQEANRMTSIVATQVSCVHENTSGIVDCMRSRLGVELVNAQTKLLEFGPFPMTLFGPVVEPVGPNAFLSRSPGVAYVLNEVPPKPWMFGLTSDEGYIGLHMLESLMLQRDLRLRWNELAPIFLDYKYTSENLNKTTEKLTKYYFGRTFPQDVQQARIAAVFGDRLFLPGVHEAIRVHSSISPTFAYLFDFRGKYNYANSIGKRSEEWGVGHGEDIYYIFNSTTSYTGFQRQDTNELALSRIMTQFLSNFATTGKPESTQSVITNAKSWEPVHPTDIKFLHISDHLKMIKEPYKKRIMFWLRLGQYDPRLLNPLFGQIVETDLPH